MTHPSMLVIDALAGGKLEGAEAEGARAHVATCARCREDLAAAEAACAKFTRDVLPRTLPSIRPRRSWWLFGPAVLAGALAVLALVWWSRRAPSPGDDDDLRIKGSLTFQVFASQGTEVIPVREGTRLRPGDRIRFVVGSGGPRYVMVASIDGAGHPSIYYPPEGARSGDATSKPSELPGSIVLDASPGPERLFALVSTEPLEASVVTRALAAIGAGGATSIRDTLRLDVPATAQASVVFEKGAP
ncbi:MAG: hypothetical protein ACTHU0_38735 [Kofleriaceae bacterium]